jgi:hypothetical protein
MSASDGKLWKLIERLKRLFKRNPEPQLPEDPYAYVTAPRKPRPSSRGAAAVADPPGE